MKKCPTCKMIVDDKIECPFCETTLTYEPPCDATKEHLLWNKYRVIYIAKNAWFSLACCLIGLLKALIANPSVMPLFLSAWAFAAISLTVSIFHRFLSKILALKYSENYLPFRMGEWKYWSGGLAIILFIFS